MSTWHQDRVQYVMQYQQYTLVSDAPNVVKSIMSFGENKEMAFASLESHRKNQPELNHHLYYRNKLVG